VVRVRDTYGVEMATDQNPALLLAVTVAIDEMAHAGKCAAHCPRHRPASFGADERELDVGETRARTARLTGSVKLHCFGSELGRCVRDDRGRRTESGA
jgi:hypothetical protein